MNSRQRILQYLEEAVSIYDVWTGAESSVGPYHRDREPIIAIATMLQAEDNK